LTAESEDRHGFMTLFGLVDTNLTSFRPILVEYRRSFDLLATSWAY
jgi:hypothetical protein